MNPTDKKLISSSLFKFTTTIIITFLGIVTSAIINRRFGAQDYGLLIMVFTVTGFLSCFSNVGSKSTLVRVIPSMMNQNSDPKHICHVIFTGFIFLGGGCVALGLLLLMGRPLIADFYKRPELLPLLSIGFFYFMSFSLIDFILSVFQSYQAWFIEGLLSILYPALFLGLILLSTLLPKGIHLILYANILAALFTAILGIICLKKNIQWHYFFSYSKDTFKHHSQKIIFFGLPLLFGELSFYFTSWGDKFFLGKYESVTTLTYYYIAFSFLNGLMLLLKSIFMVFLPYASELGHQSLEVIQKKHLELFHINMQMALGMSIVALFMIDFVIVLLYGPSYKPATLIFKYLLFVFIIKTAQLSPGIFFKNVFEMVKELNICSALMVGLNLIFLMLLIPMLGCPGAILGTISSNLIVLGVYFYLMHQKKLMPLKVLGRYFLITSLLTICYLSLSAYQWPPLFILCFMMLIWLTNLMLYPKGRSLFIKIPFQIVSAAPKLE